MKLTVPEIQIGEETGFDPKIDIFNRKGFGERLANLIENADDNPVIALDANWGEGKSTFIKMWRGYLEHERENKIKTIHFDAFENDFQKDPFLALASEIYGLLQDKNETQKTEFQEKAASVIKSLMRGALKIGVTTTTAGLINGSAIDSAEKEISNLIADQVDNIIADKFQNAQVDKLALKNFKKYLEEFAKDIGENKPIVFIIDELDRCRPDFALELLEQVKHLFSVKGITFLLVTNRAQLEESIKARYGEGVNSTNYLHKFINLWLSLPNKRSEYQDDKIDYLRYAVKNMRAANESVDNYKALELLEAIVTFYNLSLREIERVLSYFSIIHNMSDAEYIEHYQLLIAFVCFLSTKEPSTLKKIEQINYQDLIKILGLTNISEESNPQLYNLTRHIRFDLSDDQTKAQMINNESAYLKYKRMPSNVIKNVANWISEIEQE